MLKATIYIVGKAGKEIWIEKGVAEYQRRLSSSLEFETSWLKNDASLISAFKKEKIVLALDPKGKQLCSEGFATLLEKKFQEGGSRLAFAIGGAEGLPKKLRDEASLISLSSLTFTHQMARLILAEQLYRAFEILKGTPYHK